ncbi:MAG: helix-turn-helix domain-containing protein [Lachnospiraceae bacterium]|nr:helix-turn-helix domain-containing protein [Lachnospiraceae bacterium]
MKRENLASLPNMVVTSSEAAEILRISQARLGDLINAGLLNCLNIGSRKVRIATIDEFLEKWDGWDLSDPYNPKKISAGG